MEKMRMRSAMNLPIRFESIVNATMKRIKKGIRVNTSLMKRKQQELPKSFQKLVIQFIKSKKTDILQ